MSGYQRIDLHSLNKPSDGNVVFKRKSTAINKGGRPKSPNPYHPIAVRVDQKTIDIARARAELDHTAPAALYRQALELGLKAMDEKYPEDMRMGKDYPHDIPHYD